MSPIYAMIHGSANDEQPTLKRELFSGQVALITGGGSGIGLEIARALANHGCKVAICGRNEQRLERAMQFITKSTGNESIIFRVCDVRKREQVDACVDYVVEKLGKVNILVNNAAGNFLAPVSEISSNAFKTVVDIDLMGTFNCSQEVFRKCMKDMRNRESLNKVIINVSAPIHLRGLANQAHAGSAKAAVEALTRHMAVEWGQYKVRVTCVSPGPIGNTEGMTRLVKDERALNLLEKESPLGRLGTKEEVANCVLFLASPLASYVTGACVLADGGSWMTLGNKANSKL